MNIVAQLRLLSAELSSDIMVICQEADSAKRATVANKIESFLSQLRNNEGLDSFVHRKDDQDKMTILIGVSDHEAKDAIVKALWKRAEREAGNAGIRIWTKELKSSEAMHSAAELSRVARIIGVHE